MDAEGACTVEAYTVLCDQGGEPFSAPMAVRMDDGRRAVARGGGDLAAYMEREVVGERGRLTANGDVSTYHPT